MFGNGVIQLFNNRKFAAKIRSFTRRPLRVVAEAIKPIPVKIANGFGLICIHIFNHSPPVIATVCQVGVPCWRNLRCHSHTVFVSHVNEVAWHTHKFISPVAPRAHILPHREHFLIVKAVWNCGVRRACLVFCANRRPHQQLFAVLFVILCCGGGIFVKRPPRLKVRIHLRFGVVEASLRLNARNVEIVINAVACSSRPV